MRKIHGDEFLTGKAVGDICSSNPEPSAVGSPRAGVHFGLAEIIHTFEARRYGLNTISAP